MEKVQLGQVVSELFPAAEIISTQDPIRVKADAGSIHILAETLRNNQQFKFDYLYNLYGIDREDRFSIVYFFESTELKHTIAIEIDLNDHDSPVVDSLSDLYRTAEFQEREIYDLLGVIFTNHPDLRRLFLEDGWGFPLRKDYKDDINLIER